MWPFKKNSLQLKPDAADTRRLFDRFTFARFLTPAEQEALLTLVCAFLDQKRFTSRLTKAFTKYDCQDVAFLACLPILKLGLGCYDDWRSIIFVSGSGRVVQQDVDDSGVVHEYEDDIAGEVLPLGPVVISLEELALSGQGTGYNVVIHEMAHKLDMLDGAFNGCPAYRDHAMPDPQRVAWTKAFSNAWQDFSRLLDGAQGRAAKRGIRVRKGRLPLDDYAGESPEEFFAVCTEEFFERPFHLRRVYPSVYEVLCDYFGLNPYSG